MSQLPRLALRTHKTAHAVPHMSKTASEQPLREVGKEGEGEGEKGGKEETEKGNVDHKTAGLIQDGENKKDLGNCGPVHPEKAKEDREKGGREKELEGEIEKLKGYLAKVLIMIIAAHVNQPAWCVCSKRPC